MKKQHLLDIWGDTVSLSDLTRSIALSLIFTFIGYFLANSTNPTQQLFLGLLGAVIGFTLNSLLFQPKRIIIIKEEDHNG